MRRLLISIALLLTSAAGFGQSPNSIVIPAAGHVPGANGTFFKSDIAIHNLRSVEQRLRAEFLPRSGSGRIVQARDLTIAPNGVLQSDDFVEGVLSTDGLGAILLHPIRSNGDADNEGKLAVSNRIWTPQIGLAAGNASQSFPIMTLGSINSTRLAIVGLRSDTQHRINICIVNLDRTTSQTFRISLHNLQSEPLEITLDPYSMQQVPVTGLFSPGTLRVNVENVVRPGTGRLTLWTAYGSVVDNITGDSWTSIGVDTVN
jgi:hypothetical protein